MKNIIILLVLSFFIFSFSSFETNIDEFPCQSDMEYAYFCGQRDALEANIIIREISNNVWVWQESPWGNDIGVINDTIYED